MAHIPYNIQDAAAEVLNGATPQDAITKYEKLNLDVVFAVDKALLDMNSWVALGRRYTANHFEAWTAQTLEDVRAAVESTAHEPTTQDINNLHQQKR